MRLLQVIAHLHTPVVGDHDVHLDGLLERAHCHRHGIEFGPHRLENPDHLPTIPLPIARLSVLGATVPMASAWNLPHHAHPSAIHLTTRPDAEDVQRRARPFTPGAGPGRSRLIRREAVAVNRVDWWCVGDRREVLRLLRLIGQIGSMRRGGHGEVMGWEVTPSDDDVFSRVLCSDGVARRALPPAWVETPTRSIGAWRSPYWHPMRQVACALPGDDVRLRAAVMEALATCTP